MPIATFTLRSVVNDQPVTTPPNDLIFYAVTISGKTVNIQTVSGTITIEGPTVSVEYNLEDLPSGDICYIFLANSSVGSNFVLARKQSFIQVPFYVPLQIWQKAQPTINPSDITITIKPLNITATPTELISFGSVLNDLTNLPFYLVDAPIAVYTDDVEFSFSGPFETFVLVLSLPSAVKTDFVIHPPLADTQVKIVAIGDKTMQTLMTVKPDPSGQGSFISPPISNLKLVLVRDNTVFPTNIFDFQPGASVFLPTTGFVEIHDPIPPVPMCLVRFTLRRLDNTPFKGRLQFKLAEFFVVGTVALVPNIVTIYPDDVGRGFVLLPKGAVIHLTIEGSPAIFKFTVPTTNTADLSSLVQLLPLTAPATLQFVNEAVRTSL